MHTHKVMAALTLPMRTMISRNDRAPTLRGLPKRTQQLRSPTSSHLT